VVDRQQLDLIRAELNFQMSGEVSDESAQSIGQMLGVQSIMSGTDYDPHANTGDFTDTS